MGRAMARSGPACAHFFARTICAEQWHRYLDREIATLCLDRFIDRDTAALRELFASDWTPVRGMQGEVLEPGHHYEWAFLLDRWAKLTGRKRPPEVPKLIAFADAKGLDRKRRVAINGIGLDGSVDDAAARLWPQTERIRAYLIDRRRRRRSAITRGNRKLSFGISMLRCPDCGTKILLPTASSLSRPHRQQAFTILSARSRNFGVPSGSTRSWPLNRTERRKGGANGTGSRHRRGWLHRLSRRAASACRRRRSSRARQPQFLL